VESLGRLHSGANVDSKTEGNFRRIIQSAVPSFTASLSARRMKAVAIHAFGDAFGFVEATVEMPVPGEHDLLLEVHATAVNPVDTKIRRGFLGERPFPLALGYDVSGIVRAVGCSVKDFKEGDEVIGCPSLRGQGSNAEFCLIDSRRSVCDSC